MYYFIEQMYKYLHSWLPVKKQTSGKVLTFIAFSSILLYFLRKMSKIKGITAIYEDKECPKCFFYFHSSRMKSSQCHSYKSFIVQDLPVEQILIYYFLVFKNFQKPLLPTTLCLPNLSIEDILPHVLLCSGLSREDHRSSRPPFWNNQRNTEYGIVWSRYHAGCVSSELICYTSE